MDEKRRLERRQIMFYSRIFDRKTGKLLGYLGNLTIKGVMVISEEPIQTDMEFKIRVELPDDTYSKQVLSFEARSIWCEIDIDPKFFSTGFEFTKISKADLEIIEQVVNDNRLRN